jgi:hypothetical protein
VLDGAEVAAHRGLDPELLPQLAPQTVLQPLPVLDVPAGQKRVGLSLGPDDEEAVVATNDGAGEEVGGGHQRVVSQSERSTASSQPLAARGSFRGFPSFHAPSGPRRQILHLIATAAGRIDIRGRVGVTLA